MSGNRFYAKALSERITVLARAEPSLLELCRATPVIMSVANNLAFVVNNK